MSNNPMTKKEFEDFNNEFLDWIKETSLDSLTNGGDVHKPTPNKTPFINYKNLDDYSNHELITVLSAKTGKDCYQVIIELTTSAYEKLIETQQELTELRAEFSVFKQHNYELFTDLRSLIIKNQEANTNYYQSIDNQLKNIKQGEYVNNKEPVTKTTKTVNANPPPPPPPPITSGYQQPTTNAKPPSLRGAILDELKALFAKRKSNEEDEE